MSETTTPITERDTTGYIMMLRIMSDEIVYVSYHPAIDDSMTCRHIALPVAETRLQAIEQAVYAAEELLLPYKKTYVVLSSPRFVIVPAEVAAAADNSAFYTALYDDTAEAVTEAAMPRVGAKLLFGADREVVAFLQRTLDCPVLLHPLVPLSEYFYRKSRLGNQSKLYLHLYRGEMDVVCFSRNGLLLANTFAYRHVKDVMYHILNVWQQLQLDQRTDEIQLAGDATLRRELSALLRNYVNTVVPVIFPSHCHVLGGSATQLPFDLTALSLCEL